MKYGLILKAIGDKRTYEEILKEVTDNGDKAFIDMNLSVLTINTSPNLTAAQIALGAMASLLASTGSKYVVPSGVMVLESNIPASNMFMPPHIWYSIYPEDKFSKLESLEDVCIALAAWLIVFTETITQFEKEAAVDKSEVASKISSRRDAINKKIADGSLQLSIAGKPVHQVLDAGIMMKSESGVDVTPWKEITDEDYADIILKCQAIWPDILG